MKYTVCVELKMILFLIVVIYLLIYSIFYFSDKQEEARNYQESSSCGQRTTT